MPTSPENKPVVFVTSTDSNKNLYRLIRNELLVDTLRPASEVIGPLRAKPTIILDQLFQNQDRIAIFHFDGRDEHFEELLNASQVHPTGDLIQFLGKMKYLQLVTLAGCSRPKFAELRMARAKKIGRKSRRGVLVYNRSHSDS